MQISVTDIIVGITILELVIFFLILLIFSKKRSYQLLLSAFLFADALYLTGYLLFSFFDDIQPDGVHLFFIGTSFGFLLGPILYLYTRSLVKDHFRIKLKDYLHLIPFILYNLIYGFFFYFESTDTKIELLKSGSILPFSLGFRINFLMNVQVLTYTVLSLILLYNYDKRLKSLYSTIHHLSLDWLKLAQFLFLFAWLIDFIHFLIRNISGIDNNLSGIISLITFTLNLLFINLIIYRGKKQPSYFFKTAKEFPKLKSDLLSSNEEMDGYILKLKNYMATDKPYLTANLSLVELAQRLEMNPSFLLSLIKKEKRQTFFDFINNYRINDAKMILADPSKRKMTMLEVIYGVGFDSKTVFKDIFKKFTGEYPMEYRKRYLPYHSHRDAELKIPN